MSTINVTNIKGKGGASPNLPDGANVTGVVTATSFVGSGANLTGLANTDFINSEQITVVGVVTTGALRISTGGTVGPAGSGIVTYYGDGGSLTGVGETIAPHYYNPDVNDQLADADTGIGITFNKKVLAGSGTATIKVVNAGTAGTTIQSWGVSSCTFDVANFSLGSLVSILTVDQTYQLDIPSGFLVDSGGTEYVGTAYTFSIKPLENKFFTWGYGHSGQLGQNRGGDYAARSSPTQVPGSTWRGTIANGVGDKCPLITKTDGSLWSWGYNAQGTLGQNNRTNYSSPVQVGSDTTWTNLTSNGFLSQYATKTDGTFWAWGYGVNGRLGDGTSNTKSSPVQIPGTDWPKTGTNKLSALYGGCAAIKTDGTLWMWGIGDYGMLAQNNTTHYSSPRQVGSGTDWAQIIAGSQGTGGAIKTDGTLWTMGTNEYGGIGDNSRTQRSSPVQIPGTTWSSGTCCKMGAILAIKTDGTLYAWGRNASGLLGQNNETFYSSPVQIPGTTWEKVLGDYSSGGVLAKKTDGTLWVWGDNEVGMLGLNDTTSRSSPVQLGSDTGYTEMYTTVTGFGVLQADVTP